MTTFIQARFEFVTGQPASTRLALPDSDPFTLGEVLAIHFPGDAYGIVCLFEELYELEAARRSNHPHSPSACASIKWLDLGRQTLAQYLDRFVSNDPELRDTLQTILNPLGGRPLPASFNASLLGGEL